MATPTIRPSPTPSATPTGSPALLSLSYATTGNQAQTNTIGLKVQLTNLGSAINLSSLKIRYYYTSEPSSANSVTVDYASVVNGSTHSALTGQVSGGVILLSSPKTGADRYVELGFASASPSLASSGTAEIQLRITNQQWSNFSQTDDYSFLSSAQSYALNPKVVLLKDGTIVSGAAP